MAEGGDLDGASTELRSALRLKKNVGPMESLGNPRKDSSFAKYLSEPKFVALMNEIGMHKPGNPGRE